MIGACNAARMMDGVHGASRQSGRPPRIAWVVALASNDSGSNGPTNHSNRSACRSCFGSPIASKNSA